MTQYHSPDRGYLETMAYLNKKDKGLKLSIYKFRVEDRLYGDTRYKYVLSYSPEKARISLRKINSRKEWKLTFLEEIEIKLDFVF